MDAFAIDEIDENDEDLEYLLAKIRTERYIAVGVISNFQDMEQDHLKAIQSAEKSLVEFEANELGESDYSLNDEDEVRLGSDKSEEHARIDYDGVSPCPLDPKIYSKKHYHWLIHRKENSDVSKMIDTLTEAYEQAGIDHGRAVDASQSFSRLIHDIAYEDKNPKKTIAEIS